MVWGHRYSVGWWLGCYLRGRWSCVTTLSLFSSCLTGHFFPTWGLRPFLLVVTTRSAEQLDFIIAPGWWGTNSEERNTNNGRQLAWVTAYWGNISIKLMWANPQSNTITLRISYILTDKYSNIMTEMNICNSDIWRMEGYKKSFYFCMN